jgi:hypothetical protein
MSKTKGTDRAEAPAAAGGEDGRTAPNVSTTAGQPGNTRKSRLLTFVLAVIVVWGFGTYAYIYFFPHLIYNALERAMVRQGIGATANGVPSPGIPVNTLFAMSDLAGRPGRF